MRPRVAALLLVVGALGLLLWRAELFTVSRPGESARPLARAMDARVPGFEVSLPQVPVGASHVATGRSAWLVHYWAPWERHGRAQALALDSLLRTLPESDRVRLNAAIVCFDPFPSVARFVVRLRLRVPVLLDHRRELQSRLPCPSIPYTWLLDARGRVLVMQPGEVDWYAPATRALVLEAAAVEASPDAARPESDAPRGSRPPGRVEVAGTQARAAAAPGRANQRANSAWPPNRIAL